MEVRFERAKFEPIIAFFRPGATLVALEPLGKGNIHDTFRARLRTEGHPHTLLLQRFNSNVFKDPAAVMENIRQLTDFLAHAAYPLQVARPLAGVNGSMLYVDPAGAYWRAGPYIEGVYAPEDLPSANEAGAAAKAYGTFIAALHAFPVDRLKETIPGFHDPVGRWLTFQHVLDSNPAGRNASAADTIRIMLETEPVFANVAKLQRSGSLPLRVTHNDTKAGNVLLDRASGKAVAVIDLDTVMPGTVLSDFGDMVRTFTPDRYEDDPGAEQLQLRSDVLASLIRGFLEGLSGLLSRSELENLPLGAEWITAEQALRFLTDYLQGDPYYKTEYNDHNLVRARNQLALWRQVNMARVRMDRMIGV